MRDDGSTAAEAVLGDADQLMVGVLARRGPHVTPELFTVAAGRIWCLTAASTLKARLLAGGAPVAVGASAGERSVVGFGHAVVLDAAHPLRTLRHLDAGLASPLAVGQFAADNAGELVGSVLDLLTGRLGGPVPPRRVLVGIELQATAVVHGDRVVERSGWEAADEPEAIAEEPVDGDLDLLEDVPEGLRDLAADGPAFVGWTTESGHVLVAPGRWEAEPRRAVVPGSLLQELGGAHQSPACVTREAWTGFGPSGKQGVMLRGHGVATVDGGGTTIALDVDGVAYWDGVETGQARRER